jgi:hypothetical protein
MATVFLEDTMLSGKSREAKRLINGGYVGDIREIEESQWEVAIEGFKVRIALDDKGSFFYAECACGKAECSHITAAQLSLKKMLENELIMENDDKKLKKLIGEMSRSELAELAMEYAKSSKRTGKEILIRFAPRDNPLKYARTVATEIINLAKASRMVTEREVSGSEVGLGILDKLAGEALSSGEVHKAMILQSMRLDSLVELDSVICSSDQAARAQIGDSIRKIKALAGLCEKDPDLGYEFLSMLERTVPKFRKGDHNLLLFNLFQSIAGLGLNDRNVLKIEQLAAQAEAMTVDHKLSVLMNLSGLLEKGTGYLDSRLDGSLRRKTLMEAYLATEDYEKAMNVCEEAGNPCELFKLRCVALDKTGNYKKLRDAYEEHAFENSDMDSYYKMRGLYSKEEWSGRRKSMIARARSSGLEFMEEVFKQEGAKKELLEICLDTPSKIKELYQFLLPEYALDASEIMENKILSLASVARGRKGCLNVCAYLEAYIAAGGAAKKLITTICVLYPQRRIFVEMLKKYL